MLSPEEVQQRKEALEKRRELKRKYRRRQIIMYSIIAVIGIILMIMSARYSYKRSLELEPLSQAPLEDSRLNILFLGTDEKTTANVRADTIMLISIDSKTGEAGVLSIPRDTRVWIESKERWDRINATFAHGGPALAMEAVSSLLNVPIKYYVHTDFDGFKEIVDILGGVEIDIAHEMYYEDKAQDLLIHLHPGLQVLDGEKALQYVRYRDRLGDIALVDPFGNEYGGRVERQRMFFEALVDKLLSASTVPRLPRLISQSFSIVDTNLPWSEVIGLTLAGSRFSADKVKTAVLPGNSEVVNGAWYWIMNEAKAKPILDSLVWGKPEPLKLTVLNGNGRAGLAQEVANVLRNKGYDVVSLGNAEHFNFSETQIVVSADNAERVQDLAADLGAVVLVDDGIRHDYSLGSSVTIIIGQDFSIENRSVEI
ncbi:MAG: LCP family protein [Firmicutes bacterium]|nr:LCP family protein [Bacillota bacterium]